MYIGTKKNTTGYKGFFFMFCFVILESLGLGSDFWDKGLHFRNACNLSLTEQFCVP